MTRKKMRILGLALVFAAPVIATLYLSYSHFGSVSPAHLWQTQVSQPQLWVLDFVPVSFLLLMIVFLRNSILKRSDHTTDYKVTPAYRIIGLVWGTIIYLVTTAALVSYESGYLTWETFFSSHLNNPIVPGLFVSIPFFFTLGYVLEKMQHSEKENKLKSVEIQRQNEALKQEIQRRGAHEKELIEAKKEALAGVKAKDQFLSNMSHEIRTPMNGVIGLTNLLLETKLNEEQQKYASAIDYSAKNLMVIINQILDLSKINSEKLVLEHIDFDVWETIQAVENTLTTAVNEKGIVLRTLIDPSVPRGANGDPVRLNQILLNLAGNAVKFTEEGGVDILVKSKNTDDGPRLSIQVNDTGIGIPKDKLVHVFDTFTQASSETTRMYGGSGLGLAISKELVELFGGTIKVESQVGKGSSFYFDIQLKNEKAAFSTPEKTKKTSVKKLDPTGVKILLAEDNRVNQMVAKSTLEKKGFNVTIVPNGQEVIEKIYQDKFDVILMDVQMPIMGGLDATRFIRNATDPPLSDIKIIALTASAMKEDIEKCYASGMDDHLPKPFKADELMDKLTMHLEKG